MEALCTSRSHFYCNDSVNFLRAIANSESRVDLLYLDSFDVDLNDPIPSAIHGLHELLAALPFLKDGSILLVDDTPLSMDVWERVHGKGMHQQYTEFRNRYRIEPGKGALIKQFLIATQTGTMIAHDYQLLWRF
jgi:hypothetical protein